MKRIKSFLFLSLTGFLLFNCGGGGGGTDPAPAPVVTAPSYSNSVQFDGISANVPEPGSGTILVDIPLILDNTTDQDLTIDYIISGSAISGENYEPPTQLQHVFVSGSVQDDTSDSFQLTIKNDGKYSNSRELIIKLKPTGSLGVGLQSIYTITITNSDSLPTIEIDTAMLLSFGESAAGADNASSIKLTLDTASGEDTQVTVDVSDDTATEGVDYGITNKTVVIKAGDTEASLPIVFKKDDIHEPDEQFQLSISGVDGATDGSTPQTITITDSTGAPTAQFSSASSSTGEGNSGPTSVEVEVTLSHFSEFNPEVTISYNVSESTAAISDDFNLPPSPLVFDSSTKSLKASINVQGDQMDEFNESVKLTMACDASCTTADSVHELTIVDDDIEPTISFETGVSSVGEAETDVSHDVTVFLSVASGKTISFEVIADSQSTATADSDYTLPTTPIMISPGDTSADISITVKADRFDPIQTESLILQLNSLTNVTQGSTASHTISISDYTSSNPTVSFSQSSQIVLESEGTVTVGLELDNRTINAIDIPYTVGGNAISGTDYSGLTNGSVSFSANDYSKEISFTVLSDTVYDSTKDILITLGDPINANLGTNTAHRVVITDIDPPPTVEFSSSSGSLTEGDSSTDLNPYTVTLNLAQAISFDVTVPITVSGTAGNQDYSGITTGDYTISSGATSLDIDLNILGNTDNNTDKTIIVSIGAPTHATPGNNSVHTLTINDDDSSYTLNWDKSRERGVNSTGGGYMIFYSLNSDFAIANAMGVVTVANVIGETPNTETIDLPTNNYYFKIVAFTEKKPLGGEPSDQISQ